MKRIAALVLLTILTACGGTFSSRGSGSENAHAVPTIDTLTAYSDQYIIYACGGAQPSAILFDPHGDMTSITPLGPAWTPLSDRGQVASAVASIRERFGLAAAVRVVEGVSDFDRGPAPVGYVFTPAAPVVRAPDSSNPYALVIMAITDEQAWNGR